MDLKSKHLTMYFYWRHAVLSASADEITRWRVSLEQRLVPVAPELVLDEL